MGCRGVKGEIQASIKFCSFSLHGVGKFFGGWFEGSNLPKSDAFPHQKLNHPAHRTRGFHISSQIQEDKIAALWSLSGVHVLPDTITSGLTLNYFSKGLQEEGKRGSSKRCSWGWKNSKGFKSHKISEWWHRGQDTCLTSDGLISISSTARSNSWT